MFAHVANQAGDVGDVAISEWNPFRGVETEKDVAGIYVKSMLCSSLTSREYFLDVTAEVQSHKVQYRHFQA